MEDVIDQLGNCGQVLVVNDAEGHITHFCFARTQQIELFRQFPDVVNVDATHGTNREGQVSCFDVKLS